MTVSPPSPYVRSRSKRLLDVCIAASLLIICLPLLLTVALVVFAFEGRPIFFRQVRVGQGSRPFRIWKFRTMRPAAGASITVAGDARITGVGRLLRITKLDELPQLWNVCKGDMSLVGPRPEVPEFVDTQSLLWSAILQARPGMTGAASLQYPYEAALLRSVPDPAAYYREQLLPRKLSIELSYLQNCSLSTDLSLLLKTGALLFHAKVKTTAHS